MYYSGFGILSLVLYIIINNRILRLSLRKNQAEDIACYKYFLLSVITYIITDAIWGITYERHAMVTVYLDTVFYFLAMATSVLLWARYVIAYLKNENSFNLVLKFVGWLMFTFVLICLIVNFFTPILFSFDSEGVYKPLPIRYFFLGSQILLFALTAIYTFITFLKSSGVDKRHNLTIAISGMTMTLFIVLQTSNPFLPFYSIGCLLAAALIHSFVSEEELQEKNINLENALAEAERANKSKNAFLNNMSHELRTPINAILGMNEIINRDCNDEKIRECTTSIQKAGTTLLNTISSILDYSKIESDSLELDNGEYCFADMISDIYSLIFLRAEEKGLELKFDIDPEIPRKLNGACLRIKQVINNLLTNAVKYTEKGSISFMVRLISEESGFARIYFSVKDTGIGIRKEDKEKLFKAFERVNMSRTRTVEGAGLGLTISSYILNLMDSKLFVKSVYNEGSEFYFELRQRILDNAPIGDEWRKTISSEKISEKAAKKSFTSPESHILLVDDTELNLRVIKGLLDPMKMQIDTAESGELAIEKFAANTYDIVFLDYMMPHMDGIETLASIKRDYPEKADKTPIISLTASAVAGERERMLAAGFTDYMTKPVVLSVMVEMLQRYLPKEKIHTADETGKIPAEIHASENAHETLDELSAIRAIPWINVEEGIEYCGSVETYLIALSMFVNSVDDKETLLTNSLMTHDIELFTITVHALKSSSLTIGMPDFSAKAKELELAGKENNVDLIVEKYPAFIDEYRGIKTALEGKIPN